MLQQTIRAFLFTSRVTCSAFDRAVIFLVVVFFVITFSVHGQVSTLSGTVYDVKTREPIPFATVFLASTTYGVSADEHGKYIINQIKPGKYDVIVSSVGYESAGIAIEFKGQALAYSFLLKSKAVNLKEVVVDGRINKKHVATFLKYFLGTTPNADQCKVENIEALHFDYDQKHKVLHAEASEPLVVTNRALGYKVHYLLDEFNYDDSLKVIRVFGIPRFEDLPAKNERQKKHWQKARDRAYYGSVNHLMRSLYKHELRENKFSVRIPAHREFFNLDSLMHSDTLSFKGKLLFIYEESEHPDFRRLHQVSPIRENPMSIQTTIIVFTEPMIRIYENGYFENPKSIYLDGYMGWTESVAELVPLGYTPHGN